MSAMTISPVAVTRTARVRPRASRHHTSPRPVPTARVGAARVAAAPRSAAATPAARSQAPLRLTARGRLVVWLLAVALATGVGGAALSAQADGPRGATEVQRVVVAPGDTLWSLAAEVAGPGDDVRDVVLRLMELNELPAGGLQAGQTVLVPVG